MYIAFRNGVHPLTAFEPKYKYSDSRPRAVSPELAESVKSETPEPSDVEMRRVVNMSCQCRKAEENQDLVVCICTRQYSTLRKTKDQLIVFITGFHQFDLQTLSILLRMDDKMNRQLTCDLPTGENEPAVLAEELVHYGFINEVSSEVTLLD